MKIYKFWMRIKTAFFILTHPKEHWIFIHYPNAELIKLLKDRPYDDFDIDLTYHALQPYLVWKSLELVSDSMDETDMALEKAKFEGKFEEWLDEHGDTPH